MSDIRTALVAALGPLYRIEREVRPIDEYRLFVVNPIPVGPELLVKVLPAAVSLSIDADKFERELLLVSDRLRHHNLVRPAGGGRAGSFIYHTRPFIEGTTLHAWIAKHGHLPLSRAVEVIRGVLSGLAHAHKNGVSHGDLRTENILLATDRVCVVDTGIAGVLGHRATPRNDMATFARMVHEMLTVRKDEPLDKSRSLPEWLSSWVETHWTDAGKALAAMRGGPPPPPFSARSRQPYA